MLAVLDGVLVEAMTASLQLMDRNWKRMENPGAVPLEVVALRSDQEERAK